ncbi:UNVERIFIED_CONTAM: hypothetical protein PYX00_005994 [Menopon gallinae]|uniref:E3 ubiquitin-protein ligase TRIM33 n=1 Tax=Menopon gallinae TaxID=328185 RepID=A0AAW2HVE2_9NEOP
MEEMENQKLSEVTIEPVSPAVLIKEEKTDHETDLGIQEGEEPINEASAAAQNQDSPEANVTVGASKCDLEKTCEEPDAPASNPWLQVKCVFCSQTLVPSYEPKLLECLHAACSACINTKLHDQEQAEADIIESSIECPICHVLCNLQNVIDNQFLLELETDVESGSNEISSKTQDVKCSSCSDNAPATSWCVECAEFICDSCVKAHQRLKITKEHTIKAKEEAESEAQSSTSTSTKTILCSVHPQEQLTLFCEVCDRLTCRDCQLSEHRDHRYKFIHEIATETRENISGLLGEVSYKRVLLKSAMKVIDDRQNLIMEKKKILVKEITQMVVRLTNAINARGKQLVLRLNEVCDAKQKTLTEKKEALEQLSLLTDYCIDFVNNALNKGSDMALLYSKKAVTSHLQRIKSRRADIPNPEIPVRISLAFEKVPELIRGLSSVVSSIGAIVVDGRVYTSRPLDQSQPNSQQQSTAGQPQQQMQQPQNSTGKAIVKPDVSSPPQVPSYATPPPQYPGPPRPPNPAVTPPLGRSNRVSPIGAIPHQVVRNISMLRNNQHSSNYNAQQPGYNSSIGMNQSQPQISISPLSQHGPPPPPPLHPSGQPAHLASSMTPSNQVLQQMGLPPHLAVSMRHVSPSQQNQVGHPMNRLHQGNMYNLQSQSFTQQVRNTMRNQPQPAPPPYTQSQPSSGPQWHIPQQQGSFHASRPAPASLPIDESFKIHLKTQGNNGEVRSANSNSSVTSSVSKTPSPGTSREDPNTRMDKFCQDSVNDLMATIAKLDSNGIEVIPEMGKQQVDSLVDSSTPGFCSQGGTMKSASEPTKEDSNEDWCAVCMDGGELICCDNCPKVFHVNCHIPALKSIPGESETWQCLLCTDVANLVPPEDETGKRKRGLSYSDRKLAERVVLELYCQYESSIHFRDLPPPDDSENSEKVKKPMALEVVKKKLDPENENYYSSLPEVIADVRRIFKNAKIYHNKESQVYQDAKLLEEFFERLLTRWIPDYAFDQPDSDDEVSSRKFRRIDTALE